MLEDPDFLVLEKPSRMPMVKDDSGDPSLVDFVWNLLQERNVPRQQQFVGVVHRIDRPTSGLVIIALNADTAEKLSDSFRKHQVKKIYMALLGGQIRPQKGRWEDFLLKDRETNTSKVVKRGTTYAKFAALDYVCHREMDGYSLVEMHLDTGRSHQIRVQSASRRVPVLGDRKYGSKWNGGGHIALHAGYLEFPHPVSGKKVIVKSLPPTEWAEWFGLNDEGSRQDTEDQ